MNKAITELLTRREKDTLNAENPFFNMDTLNKPLPDLTIGEATQIAGSMDMTLAAFVDRITDRNIIKSKYWNN